MAECTVVSCRRTRQYSKEMCVCVCVIVVWVATFTVRDTVCSKNTSHEDASHIQRKWWAHAAVESIEIYLTSFILSVCGYIVSEAVQPLAQPWRTAQRSNPHEISLVMVMCVCLWVGPRVVCVDGVCLYLCDYDVYFLRFTLKPWSSHLAPWLTSCSTSARVSTTCWGSGWSVGIREEEGW